MRETTNEIDQIAAFGKHTNSRGILLVGGPMEVVRIGHAGRVVNCALSLNNPCGPVLDTCHHASMFAVFAKQWIELVGLQPGSGLSTQKS